MSMRWIRRLLNVLRARSVSRHVDDELEFHIEELTDELVGAGWSRERARQEAVRRFGNYASRREEVGDVEIARWLQRLGADFRYGARQLRAAPAFTLVAVFSLALGIGANSAIFQLINAVGLRGLPVRQPDRLAAVDAAPGFFASGWSQGRHRLFTYAQVDQLSTRQEAFSAVLAFGTTRFNLNDSGDVRYAEGLFVTPNFLDVLGVAPVLGSWLPAATDPKDCSQAGALLDYGFWQREYGGDRGVIGRAIRLNGRSLPIRAVTPRSFFGVEPGRRFDVAVPICADALFADDGQGRLANRRAWWLTPIGRLKPGWSVDRAAAHLTSISPAIFRDSQPEGYPPDSLKRYLANRLTAVPAYAGVSDVRREYATPLWILLTSTAFVLLIACANLANLLMARASAREREIALRQALGASRGRVVAQLLAESLLLAGAGALLGSWLAHLLGGAIVWFISTSAERLEVPLTLDWRVVGFTAAIAVATVFLFGLLPALRATRTDPILAMRGGRGAASSPERHGLRRALIVFQVALSLVLLVGALLLAGSLRKLQATETGFVSEGVLVADVSGRLSDLDTPRRLELFRQLADRIAQLPGVASASLAAYTPLDGNQWNEDVHADRDPATTGGRRTWFNRVGPDYLRTLGIPLIAGRTFTDRDAAGTEPVAIVNELFAREVFGTLQAVGRTFRYEVLVGQPNPVFRVVGVAGNTKYSTLREAPRPIVFLPVAQDDPGDRISIVIHARGTPGAIASGVKARMAELDGRLLVEFHDLEGRIAESLTRDRLVATLSEGFGLLALLLSMLGLYGVMSYIVARRRTEIGVRMALGARPGSILRMVLVDIGWLLGIGLAGGLAASLALSKYLRTLLFNQDPNDMTTILLACALLTLTGFIAAFIPMRRAASVDPAIVLRSD
jgi:predicted permease